MASALSDLSLGFESEHRDVLSLGIDSLLASSEQEDVDEQEEDEDGDFMASSCALSILKSVNMDEAVRRSSLYYDCKYI